MGLMEKSGAFFLHDSIPMDQANKHKNHVEFLYEHDKKISMILIFPNLDMKMFGHWSPHNDFTHHVFLSFL